MGKLRILLADDHAMLRQGLRLLINAQPDMEVVGEAGDGRSTLRQALDVRPDVVVMDISMPGLNGQQATAQLKEMRPKSKVIALTRHNETSCLQQILHAGASGYVLKQNDAEELIRAIRAVAEGGMYIDPAVAGNFLNHITGRPSAHDSGKAGSLSEREAEVLRLIAKGYSNKEIATRLELSVKTVEAHKAHAMKKLDLISRVDIVRYALIQGWFQDI
jgi:DNA-binding NarL/FixJ family response regulator